MRIVLDTNVLVSALLKRGSPPSEILDSVLAGNLRILLDERIRTEYERVIRRPRFHISVEQAGFILSFINQSGFWVSGPPISFPGDQILDCSDLPFAEVAVWGEATALVTGNIKHYTYLESHPVKVLLPRDFLNEYGKSG
jgi:putative PIN family toxin of toxin-antitoxin system